MKLGFSQVPEALAPTTVKLMAPDALKPAFLERGIHPRTIVLGQPIVSGPLIAVRYRQGEYHSTSVCGQPDLYKAPNVTRLAKPALYELPGSYLDTVSRHLSLDTENLFVLGQIALGKEHVETIKSKLPKITGPSDLALYVLNGSMVNPKLAEMLRFIALDVYGLWQGRLQWLPIPQIHTHQHLQSVGFHQLWGKTADGADLRATAKEFVSGAAVNLLEYAKAVNSSVNVTGLRLVPFFRSQDANVPLVVRK